MIYEPYPYQQYCAARIVADAAVGLFLDMGLGKTVITLDAINTLRYDRWAVQRVLIIAPKKVAEGTWTKEAQKWEHLRHLRISAVLGSQQKRLRALATPADIYVINRDNVAWLVDYFKNAWPFDMVVLDESSSFKNSQSKRFKALKLVRSRINRLVELTGTPASNGLIDLWAQIYLLDGGARLGRTLGQYRERFFDPDKRSRTQIFSYTPKDGSMEYIQQAIGDICVSMKAEDYLNLPDRMFDDVPVVLDDKARKAYRQLERDLLLELDEGQITAASAGVLTGKLLQLCNGAVYDSEKRPLAIHNCKVEAFLEVLEQLNGQHCLVFYNFQHDRDRLLAALEPLGLRVRVYQNAADEDAWNAGEIDVLLAHPASCAYGLNLQNGGHHIVWFGLTWSLEQYEQANKRLHRQGQRHPVIVHHLVVQGGMDEDVIESLRAKGDTQEALMDALKARIKKARETAV
ncbi:MAG TPA: DEAD/DEAH box helicase [Candidatus Avidehalobacter gallistercoris]|uniref:DEAD/DEAH box helicase n=1 Tax=Candidatus Avidehalobacter gallistercoris TaxID=2840694 RepID=A0A9D1HM19_9FIRM|nr:DEAD/DEAH box helicase [Candidatus Avidehalobacter gallistercoris]